MADLVSYDKALEIVLHSTTILKAEEVSLTQSLYRTLAADIFSDMDMPPFDKSSMDGYACRFSDLANPLEVIEEIPAGKVPQKIIHQGECARIMTGAMVPDGADCVVMQEHIHEVGPARILFNGEKTKKNICYQGEDVHKGDKVISQGTLIQPQHIAILAAVGETKPKCHRLPLVSVMATGSELVEPGDIPLSGQIRNSNSVMLMGLLQQTSMQGRLAGLIADDPLKIAMAVENALSDSDVVLISGGSSAGDYDFVPDILKKSGFELLFEKVNVQPGKPLIFARKGNKFCFGMPGNPVSCFVQFHLLVKPFLLKLMGYESEKRHLKLTLGEEITLGKSTGRMVLLPVNVYDSHIYSIPYHGSADITSFAKANALIIFPEGTVKMSKGELADIIFLNTL
jgi:molybdopterin molybdotransferase